MRRIERIGSAGSLALVPVENSSEARWATTADGRRWVLKWESDTGCEPLLAEALGWLVGDAMGLPQPKGAVLEGEDGRGWLSAVIPDALHWSPHQLLSLVNLDALGAVIAFDAVVLNEDRHAGNLLLQPVSDVVHPRVWAIDAGNARIGWVADFVEAGLVGPSTRNLAPGLRGLPQSVEAAALSSAERASELDIRVVETWVDEACEIAREPRREELTRALARRLHRAPVIVRDYIDRLRETP